MRILIRTEDIHLRIPLPTRLAFNHFTAGIAVKYTEQNNIPLNKQQIYALMRALQQGKSCLHGQPLVEIESANGDSIEIRL